MMTWRMKSTNERGLVASSAICLTSKGCGDVTPLRGGWLSTWMRGTWNALNALLAVGTHSRCGAGSPARLLATHGHSLVSQLWDYIALLLTERKFVVEAGGWDVCGDSDDSIRSWAQSFTFGVSPLCGITRGPSQCSFEYGAGKPEGTGTKPWAAKLVYNGLALGRLIIRSLVGPPKITRTNQNKGIRGKRKDHGREIHFDIPDVRGGYHGEVQLDDQDPDLAYLLTRTSDNLLFLRIDVRRSFITGYLSVLKETKYRIPSEYEYLQLDVIFMRSNGHHARHELIFNVVAVGGRCKILELEEGAQAPIEIADAEASGLLTLHQLNEYQFCLVSAPLNSYQIWECQELSTRVVATFPWRDEDFTTTVGGFVFSATRFRLEITEITTGRSGIRDHRIILDDKDPDVVTLFTNALTAVDLCS
ncbi:hypothetical protein Pelo_2704 [Pelomyxa schiedti]|nr:hypothetical protein Pelo_2704 [Pelomyxa schiedti]